MPRCDGLPGRRVPLRVYHASSVVISPVWVFRVAMAVVLPVELTNFTVMLWGRFSSMPRVTARAPAQRRRQIGVCGE